MQNNIIVVLLKNENISDFIEDNIKKDTIGLALKLDYLKSDERIALLTWLRLLQKARYKLPLWYENRLALTPKSYEQSTSQAVADYKAGLFSGHNMINLTGGLGVDDVAFSGSYNRIISVDIDAGLNDMVAYNNYRLHKNNIERHTAEAAEWIRNYEGRADLIYIDPDRRPGGYKKFSIKESQPDILALLPVIKAKTGLVAIKLSPMADITACLRELPGTSRVYVIAADNEMKELLFVLEEKAENRPEIITVNISGGHYEIFSSAHADISAVLSPPRQQVYFYEPNIAIIKAKLCPAYAGSTGTFGVNREGTYAVSEKPVDDYSGRSFHIVNMLPVKKAAAYLKQEGLSKANIARRDYPENTETLRKKYRLKEGGEDYLFFTTTIEGEKLLYHCRRVD